MIVKYTLSSLVHTIHFSKKKKKSGARVLAGLKKERYWKQDNH